MATAAELTKKSCTACEGGVPKLTPEQVARYLPAVPQWRASGDRIARSWRVKDFTEGLDFFRRVGALAEAEGHHPDLHLANYRDVTVEIWTHAVGGLTENDFILAAKIDALKPPALKGAPA
jgi:4a-hydroxytetrahydrobiopterin dehydratase